MSPSPLPQASNALHRTKRPFASLRTIIALVLREMVTTYGRSPGGYLWAVLEPVAGIALLTLIFSAGFRAPALGTSFPLFYATGMLPFLMFSDVSSKVAMSILFSKPLLAYPAVTYLDAILARFIVNLLTQLMVAYLLLIGIMTFFNTQIVPDYPAIVVAFVSAASLGLGIGTLNCYLFIKVPVWQRTWSILMRPMFLISCIFFLFETVPQPYRDALWYNPVIHVIGQMRQGFYANYDAPYVSLIYVFGISMLCMLAGLVLLYRGHRVLMNDG